MKKGWIELLRIFACICVILIHISYQGVWRSVYELDIDIWKLHITIDLLSQCAVPLFVMISGYLLIGNEKFKGKKIACSILKLSLIYIITSIFYSLYNNIIIPKQFDYDVVISNSEVFHNVILNIFSGEYHLWFIPMLIGLYFITPLINKIKDNKSYLIIFLILWIVFNTIDTLSFIATDKWYQPIFYTINKFKLPLISNWMGYYILGHLIKSIRHRKFEIFICVLGYISIFLTIINTYKVASVKRFDTIALMNNMSIWYVLYVLAIFLTFKLIFENRKIPKFIIYIGSSTLYIYLSHVYFIDQLFYSKIGEDNKNSIRYIKGAFIDYDTSVSSLVYNLKYVFIYSLIFGLIIITIRKVIRVLYGKVKRRFNNVS